MADDGDNDAALEHEAADAAENSESGYPDVGLQHEAAPLVPAAPLAPQPQVPAPGIKVGVATKGMTPEGLQLSRGLFGQADAATQQFAQADQARADADAARMQADYAAAAKPNQDIKAAQAKYEEQNQKLLQQEQDFNRANAELEKRFTAEAQAERQRYLATYQEQLAGVRQLAAQSGNPISGLSPGEAMGLAGAQFAQGFLAARGIHIDVAGQVDRWVERSIQEHQQAVQNAREDANDSLHLYDIARQSSQDDFEARQRYRGFVIQGLQTAITMNASKFQSQIAMANADAQNAKLQIEADTTARSIADQHFNRVHTILQANRTAAFQQGQLAMESKKLDLEQKKLDLAKNAAKATDVPQYVVDPSNTRVDALTKKPTSGGKIVGVINTKAAGANDTAKLLGERNDFKKQIDEGIAHLRDLAAKVDGDTWSDKFRQVHDEDFRRFNDARQLFLSQMLQAVSGKVVTENEYDRWKATLDENRGWQSGKNAFVFAEMQEAGARGVRGAINYGRSNGTIQSVVGPIDPRVGADAEGYSPKPDETDPAERARMEADLHGGKPVETFVQSEVDATKSSPKDVVAPSRAYSSLVATDKNEQQPHNTVPVELLVRTFLDPAYYREKLKDTGHAAGLPEDDEQVKRDAIDGLERLATGKDIDPYVQGYARIMLDKLTETNDAGDHPGQDELRGYFPIAASYADPTKDTRRTASGHTPKAK